MDLIAEVPQLPDNSMLIDQMMKNGGGIIPEACTCASPLVHEKF
jgi:hypothetical protein